jgi:hypothetical protein
MTLIYTSQWYITITAFAFFAENRSLQEVRKGFFLRSLSFFMKKILRGFRRKFFRTPSFPLEIFAENEKYPGLWKKYKEEVQKKVYFRKQAYTV